MYGFKNLRVTILSQLGNSSLSLCAMYDNVYYFVIIVCISINKSK